MAVMFSALLIMAGCYSVKEEFSRLQDIGKEYCSARNMQFKGLYSASGGIFAICHTSSPYKEYSFQVAEG